MVVRIVLLLLGAIAFSCTSSKHENDDKSDVTGKLKFEVYSYNFGKLKHGDIVGHRFKFYNNGDAPVIIQAVDKACGCTDVIYPKKPILPEDTAFVEIIFDSNGWNGRQVKRVALTANDSAKVHELLIWAEIK